MFQPNDQPQIDLIAFDLEGFMSEFDLITDIVDLDELTNAAGEQKS